MSGPCLFSSYHISNYRKFSCEKPVKTRAGHDFSAFSQVSLGFFTGGFPTISNINGIQNLKNWMPDRFKGERHMSNKKNLVLDIIIFVAFLAVANPSLTGMTLHEWLALAFAAAIVTHLLFHWKWLVAVTRKFFHKLIHQSRLNYIVDALFFVAMTAAMFSGLLISKSILATLGIQLDVSRSWKTIHTLASDASLILLGLHFALHFANLKRYLVSPVIRVFRRSQTDTLAPQSVRIHKGQ
jgi:hypothetical protein